MRFSRTLVVEGLVGEEFIATFWSDHIGTLVL
jgi:hypothetical protein